MSVLRGGILVLCDANVCRSAMAELVIRSALAAEPPLASVPVNSAGVRARDSLRVCGAIQARRADPQWASWADAHRSHTVEGAAIEEANLVLAATRSVRSEAVALAPNSRHRIFTLREAVWLSSGVESRRHDTGLEAIDDLVAQLDGQRGLRPVHQPPWWRQWRRPVDPLDIPDRHGSRTAAHNRAIRTVEQSAEVLATILTGSIDESRLTR